MEMNECLKRSRDNNPEIILIPDFLLPLWRLKLREKHKISINDDVLMILLKTHYAKGTWKWQRAYTEIMEKLEENGYSSSSAKEEARRMIKLFNGV